MIYYVNKKYHVGLINLREGILSRVYLTVGLFCTDL